MKKRNKIFLYIIIFATLLIVSVFVKSLSTKANKDGVIIPIKGTISAGFSHTVALKADGTVVATGDNSYGQCNVKQWENVTQVSAGRDYTIGLTQDGKVLFTGDESIELSEVQNWKDIRFISAGWYSASGITKDGKIVTTDDELYELYDIDGYRDIVFLDSCSASLIAIDSEGNIINLSHSQESLGEDNPTLKRTNEFAKQMIGAKEVKSSFLLNIALFDSGELIVKYTLDSFEYLKMKQKNIVQFDVEAYDLVMLDKYGAVKMFTYIGEGEFDQFYSNEIIEWSNIISVDAGHKFAIGLNEDGTVVASGDNEHGQCDVSEWTDIATEPLPMNIESN